MFDVVAVEELGRKIAGLDPEVASPEDLLAAAPALVRLGSQVKVGLGRVLAGLERRGICGEEFGLGPDGWLARETGAPKLECTKDLRTGRQVRRGLAGVEAAVTEGTLTWDHARVLAHAAAHPRVGDQIPGLAEELVAMADGTSFALWAGQVRALVEWLDQDGPHDPNTELARNRLHLSGTLDGVTAVSGQLGGDHALTVRQAIEAVADELFRRYTADHGVDPSLAIPARATLRALALAELCRRAGAVDVQASKPPRPEVTLVVHASAPHVAADEDGVWLADGTSRTLVCDAELYPLVIDSLGVPLDLGHRIRVAPRRLRRVLAARDGGCVFPGCDVPARWCDYHHLDAFAAGGDTTVTNLAGLCRHHHRITHRPGWRMHATDDGWYWWQTPTDRTFWSQRHHHQHPAPPPHPRH